MKDKKSLRYCLEKLENGGNWRRHNGKMQYGILDGIFDQKKDFCENWRNQDILCSLVNAAAPMLVLQVWQTYCRQATYWHQGCWVKSVLKLSRAYICNGRSAREGWKWVAVQKKKKKKLSYYHGWWPSKRHSTYIDTQHTCGIKISWGNNDRDEDLQRLLGWGRVIMMKEVEV